MTVRAHDSSDVPASTSDSTEPVDSSDSPEHADSLELSKPVGSSESAEAEAGDSLESLGDSDTDALDVIASDAPSLSLACRWGRSAGGRYGCRWCVRCFSVASCAEFPARAEEIGRAHV